MKKGFTLIELLAVIVILAIIALIATPIILGIINDAREESNERSVELYASAVRNGIAAYQLREGKEVTAGTYNETNKLPFEVEYDGQVDCTSVIITEEGKVTLEGCTVNGGTKEYSYGMEEEETPDSGEIPDSGETPSAQVYKPQYYYFGFDWSGTVGETEAPANPSTEPPTGKRYYLGYDVTDGKVSTGYACFTRNDTEYCLKGHDTEAFATNTEIIKDVYADVLDDACFFYDNHSNCSAYDLDTFANSNGNVSASDEDAECFVSSGGEFECHEFI